MTDESAELSDLDDALEEIEALLEEQRVDEVLGRIAALHAADQAEVMARLDAEQRAPLLSRIPRDDLAEIVSYLREEPRKRVIEELDPALLGPLLDELEQDLAVDVLHELPAERAQAALRTMHSAPEIAPLLPHADKTAGGRMTRDFVALHRDWTVDQALDYLRRTKPEAEQSFYLYVVDDGHRLQGVVSLRGLVVAQPEQHIGELMTPEVVAVGIAADQEEVARRVQRYNFVALPVVDDERRLVGVVAVDDVIDVVEEEATEDMYRMVGLLEDESLLRPVTRSIAPRLTWLLLNLVTALAAAAVVSGFEGTIERVAALAVFMPVIAALGGNTGIQTITLMVRSLALGAVQLADVRRVLQREVLIGVVNGVVIGLLLGIVVYIWKGNAGLATVAGVALLLNMTMAVTAGVLVPLSLRALKLDPALASGVLVTTFTDVLGFFFFLGLATLLVEQIA